MSSSGITMGDVALSGVRSIEKRVLEIEYLLGLRERPQKVEPVKQDVFALFGLEKPEWASRELA